MAEQPTDNRSIGRSAAYPGFSLEQSIEATRVLRTNLGSGPYSRESAARALGYSGVSGSSSTKIAACAHFGLLAREGNAYKQSDLANQIFSPQSEDEKSNAIRAAFATPTLYSKLISAFEGRALPVMLDNILVRQYGIQERVAAEVAGTFKKSAEFAGVLSNGVLKAVGSEQAEDQPQMGSSGAPAAPELGRESESKQQAPKDQADLKVPVSDTGIVVLFPSRFAYNLSVGAFASGVKELAKNASEIGPEVDDVRPES